MSASALDESALDLRFTHAFDIRINFDKRWLIGPVSGGANLGYTSIGEVGYVHGPLPPDIPAYFRCTPYFRAPVGPHEWLNRTVVIGVGQRRPKLKPEDPPDHSLFRYYAVL